MPVNMLNTTEWRKLNPPSLAIGSAFQVCLYTVGKSFSCSPFLTKANFFSFCFIRFQTKALAEILSLKHLPDGQTRYYVHYIDYNKRLDEWVDQKRLDLSQVQMPKTDNKSGQAHLAPLKNGSRSCSPDRDPQSTVASTVRFVALLATRSC